MGARRRLKLRFQLSPSTFQNRPLDPLSQDPAQAQLCLSSRQKYSLLRALQVSSSPAAAPWRTRPELRACHSESPPPAPGVQFFLKRVNSRQAWTCILPFGQPLHPPGIYRPPANLPPKFRSSWLPENFCLTVWILEAPRSPRGPLEIPRLPSSSRF